MKRRLKLQATQFIAMTIMVVESFVGLILVGPEMGKLISEQVMFVAEWYIDEYAITEV